MLFGCWNIRGLNDPLKQSELQKFIIQKDVSFMGIVETKVRDENINSVCNYVAKDWSFETNFGTATSGRILIMWNSDVLDVRVLCRTDQIIHCEVWDRINGWKCVISVVYALNNPEGRKGLWDSVSHLSQDDTPWMLMGDFNAIRSPTENWGDQITGLIG